MAFSGETSFARYVLKRVAYAVPTIVIITLIAFLLIQMAPGDPVLMFIGEVGVSPEYIEFLRAKFGLDKPLYEQFIRYISLVLRGDLGRSIYFRRYVSDLIIERLFATLLLISASTFIATAFGILFGVIASKKQNTAADIVLSTTALIGYSTPIFWSGQIALIIFSLYLGWLPTGGMTSLRVELTGFDYVLDLIRHLILPAFSLGFFQLALVSRITRASMLEILKEDYVLAARARGLKERVVIYKHALRNALIPVITVVGLNLGRIFAGAVLTETTFSWPGLGHLLWQAVTRRDYPVLLGVLIFVSAFVMIINIVVDILYAIVDPRIRGS